MHQQRMNSEEAGMDAMDLRVVRALETKAEVHVPADFAARVARRLPARKPVVVTPARYGLLATRMGIAVLTLALVVLAMHSGSRTTFGVALQWILCAQLAGLAMWQGGMWRVGAPDS
jgi:hypothetical protein